MFAEDANSAILQLTKADFTRLPVWGTIPYSGSDRADLSVGQFFYGENPIGVIRLENTSGDSLQLSDIQSSCGCTVAKRLAEFISPGASEYLLVNISTEKFGPVGAELRFKFGNQTKTVAITGDVVSRFDCDSLAIEFNRDGVASVGITIRDPAMVDSQVKLKIATNGFRLDSLTRDGRSLQLKIQRALEGVRHHRLVIIPVIDGHEDAQLNFTLSHIGRVLVIPSTLFVSQRSSDKVRLFLSGDLSYFLRRVPESTEAAELDGVFTVRSESGDVVEVEASVAIRRASQTIVLSIDSNPFHECVPGRYGVRFAKEEFSFEFNLQVR